MAKKKKARTPNVPPSSYQPPVESAAPSTTAPAKTQTATSATKVRTSQRERERRRNQLLLIGGAIAIGALVLAALIMNSRAQAQVAAPPAASDFPAELIARNVKGSPEAQVVVAEYSDFECPYCKTFAQGPMEQLADEYIRDGRVRFEFKHYPLPQHNPSATQAALAAECAADQGRFWDMHDYLFQEAGKQGTNTFSLNRLQNMADQLGLDTAAFNSCLSNQTHIQTVQGHIREGQDSFVNATPTVIVNGQKLGTPDYATLKAAIDAELQRLGQS